MRDFVPQPHMECLPELYGADPAQILAAVRSSSAAGSQRLMVIGHNPGMHELALALAGSGDAAAGKALAGNLPTSGLAILDFAVDDWADVAFRRGRLVLFVSPKLLKQTSGE
jgi:phosphohistidine phosphatase